MKKILGFLLFSSLCVSSTLYAQEKQTLVGKITTFEGADNFYLTIVDKKGKAHQGLCRDMNICEKLATSLDDPNLAGYKGKKVKVTVSKGDQYDAEGNVFGTMDAFEKIELLK